jgi:hypothetical protein
MNEVFNFLNQQDINTPILIFLMLFSCGIALFHTLIFSALYNLSLRPKWLFFALNPILIGLGYLYRPGFSLLAFAFLFASVFIFGLIGMIYAGIIQSKQDKIDQKNFDARYHVPKSNKLKNLAMSLGFLAIIGLGIWLHSEGKLSLLLVIIPVMIVLDGIFLPTRRSNFYKFQAILPTSKMNGIAMGLVEVVGDLVEINPILSPHFNTPCIGYAIRIEKRSQDNDGKTTWSTIFRDSKTGDFKIKDDTGTVMVNGEGLEYYFTRVDKETESGDKRYYETYLKHDDYIFLIGKANSLNGDTVIERDDYHKVFGAALPHEIAIKNKFAPLYKSFFATLFFITLLIIYIVIT